MVPLLILYILIGPHSHAAMISAEPSLSISTEMRSLISPALFIAGTGLNENLPDPELIMQYDSLGSGYWPTFADPAVMRSGDPSLFMSTLHMALVEIAGAGTVPQIIIHDKPIGGFDKLLQLEQTGELNKLL